jgi:hypothetical protein
MCYGTSNSSRKPGTQCVYPATSVSEKMQNTHTHGRAHLLLLPLFSYPSELPEIEKRNFAAKLVQISRQ